MRALPAGCGLHRLTTHADHRGALAEVFRNVWFDMSPAGRWQASRCVAGSLRGVYVSTTWTFAGQLRGAVCIGLHDLRPSRRSARQSVMISLDDTDRHVIRIAPGVAYGFYFPGAALLLGNALDGAAAGARPVCHWNSPELGLPWPCAAPLLDEDEAAGLEYADFEARFAAGSARS